MLRMFFFVMLSASVAVGGEKVELFGGRMPKGMKWSTWNTFTASVDRTVKTPAGNASLKITSSAAFAGGNYVYANGTAFDLSTYWKKGALRFLINRNGTCEIGTIELQQGKGGAGGGKCNSADYIEKFDTDLSTWQEIIIPLTAFAEKPVTTFTGLRIRVGRKVEGAAYMADIQIVPTYDPAKVPAPKSNPKAGKSYLPRRTRYVPAKQAGLSLQVGEQVTVKVVPVVDSRLVRGFFGRTVDGRIDSYGWEGNGSRAVKKRRPIREWPNIFSGVDYTYNKGDGVHITLADAEGVDLVVVQGDYAGTLRSGVTHYATPYGGEVIATIKTGQPVTQLSLPERVRSNTVSFVDRTGGTLANVAFYRVMKGETPQAKAVATYSLTAAPQAASKEMAWYISRLFEPVQVYPLVDKTDDTKPIDTTGQYIHLTTPPCQEGMIGGVRLKLNVQGLTGPTMLRLRLADPMNPRLELAYLDLSLAGNGVYGIELDTVDQKLMAGTRVWVTLALEKGRIVTGGTSTLQLTPGGSMDEYIAYRKRIFKGYFATMIELRPWYKNRKVFDSREKVLALDSGECIWEMIEQLHHLKAMAPDDREVDTYYKHLFGYRRDELPVVPVEGDAPAWARLSRKNLGQLLSVAGWWIKHRQTPNGEFGGAVNDDTCLLMNFQNYPLCDSHDVGPKLRKAYVLLAEHAAATTMRDGLNTNRQDPLHAYEEGLNVFATMPWLFYGDPVYVERCMASARSLLSITRKHESGRRYFFQDYRKVGQIKKGDGTDWHYQDDSFFMMLHPALTLTWYNQHPQALTILREILDSYYHHMQPGKWPVKIYPGTQEVSYRTNRPFSFKADSAVVHMFYNTGDTAYLNPFFDAFKAGNWGWASHRSLMDIMMRYELTKTFPLPQKLLDERPYVRFMVTGDKTGVEKNLQSRINDLEYFMYHYTDAEIFVDRLFVNNDVLKSSLGGYAMRNKLNPSMAIEWRGLSSQDYASFVLLNRQNHLKVAVYNFTERELAAELLPWQLLHGTYSIVQGIDADGDDKIDGAGEATTRPLFRHSSLPVRLAPKQTTIIDVVQKEARPSILKRTDIALAKREARYNKVTGELTVIVHNIGTQATGDVLIVADVGGKVVSQVTVPSIAPPLDLLPKTAIAKLTLPAGTSSFTVIADPKGGIAEITKENNRFAVR